MLKKKHFKKGGRYLTKMVFGPWQQQEIQKWLIERNCDKKKGTILNGKTIALVPKTTVKKVVGINGDENVEGSIFSALRVPS